MKKIVTILLMTALTLTTSAYEEKMDSLTIFLQAGDSCMQQFNTFEALSKRTPLLKPEVSKRQ